MKIKKFISAALAAAICVTSSAPSAFSRTLAFDTELNAETVFTTEGKSSFGDTDGNGAVDASDASLVLSDYSLTSTGGTSMFNATQKLNADINADGSVDASDASYILSYYAYISTGGKLTLTEFLKPQQPAVTTTTPPVTTTTAAPKPTTTAAPKPTTTVAPKPTTTVAPKPTTTAAPKPTTTVAPKPTTTVAPKPTTTVAPKPTTTTLPPVTTTAAPKPTTTVPPVTTTEANAKVSDIRITRNEMVINVGEGDLSAYVTMLPANAKNKAEMWSSSDESIAIVDNEGWVVGVGEGECFITVTSIDNPAVYAKIKVTVNDTKSVKSIRLSRTSMTMQAGTGELAARVTMLPETALNKKEIWTSSQPDVATVDSEGWVTALKPGNTIISVQSVDNPSVYGMVLVTVTAEQVTSTSATTASTTTVTTTTTTVPPVVTTTAPFVDVQEVKFGDTEVTLKAGTSYTPILAIAPENATNKTLIWTSSNNSIATVSSNGVITAVKEGICYITASSASNPAVRAVAIVNVTNNTSTGTVTEIRLSKYEMQLSVGSTDLSWVTMLPADAPNKEEFWTTSDPTIATVDEYGWVKGVSTGECIVTVYSVDNHNVKAEIKVKVVSGPVEAPKYTFSQIAPGKSTAKEIAFLTPFPENADGLFIFDYFITDANGNKRLTSTYVMDSADTENVITMLTADTNHFSAELYVTNLNTSKRAKIGSYNFVINPRNAQTEEEAIEYAFAAVGGLK